MDRALRHALHGIAELVPDANDRDIPMHALLTMLIDVAECAARLTRSEQLDRLLSQFGALTSRHLQALADGDSALGRPLGLVARRASALQQANADEVLTAVQAMTFGLHDLDTKAIDVSDRAIDLWHASVQQPAGVPDTTRQPHPRPVSTRLT